MAEKKWKFAGLRRLRAYPTGVGKAWLSNVVTIPPEVIHALNWHPGQYLEIWVAPEEKAILLLKARQLRFLEESPLEGSPSEGGES